MVDGPNRLERGLGAALEGAIQRSVRRTGRLVRPAEAAWLVGPVGTSTIGPGFAAAYAREAGLAVATDAPGLGLLPDAGLLRGPGFDPDRLHPVVRGFYERTADHRLEVWAQWRGPLAPFAHTLVYLVSRSIEQLNLPRAPLETSRGISSELTRLNDPRTGDPVCTAWLRRARATGRVVFAGFYGVAAPPLAAGPCVRVVFPLPGGSATVLLRPEHRPGGGLCLVSAGRGFGDAGYYRVHRVGADVLRVRRLPLDETIAVSVDGDGVLRTDHAFRFGPFRFLDLHYKIAPAAPRSAP